MRFCMTGLDCIIVLKSSGLFIKVCIMGLSGPIPACRETDILEENTKQWLGRGNTGWEEGKSFTGSRLGA